MAFTISSMLRNKGGQQASSQGGYQPLPGRSGSPPGSNVNPPLEKKLSGGFVRKISPGPEQTKRVLDRPLNTNARVNQPSINRTIAPGQVCYPTWLLWPLTNPPCGSIAPFLLCSHDSCALQPAPGQRSKEKFVSLPEVDEDIESQLSIPDAPPTLFEVGMRIELCPNR